jgi:hypothetical protein
MPSVEKRLARLSGRTSRDAWLELQRLKQHANFYELLVHLEKKEGTLLVRDVERAVKRFLNNHEDQH